jgi:hypothetical protein
MGLFLFRSGFDGIHCRRPNRPRYNDGMSTITQPAAQREVIYPDSDGQPIAENTLQFRWIVTIEGGLEAQYRGTKSRC